VTSQLRKYGLPIAIIACFFAIVVVFAVKVYDSPVQVPPKKDPRDPACVSKDCGGRCPVCGWRCFKKRVPCGEPCPMLTCPIHGYVCGNP